MAIFDSEEKDDARIVLLNKDGSKELASVYAYKGVSKEGLVESLKEKGLNVQLVSTEIVDKPEL